MVWGSGRLKFEGLCTDLVVGLRCFEMGACDERLRDFSVSDSLLKLWVCSFLFLATVPFRLFLAHK